MGTLRKYPRPLEISDGIRKIRVPAGLPPVPLRGKLNDMVIRRWALDTRDAFAQEKSFLANEGLCYLLANYFIDPNDYPKAFERATSIINQLPDEPEIFEWDEK